MPLLWNRPEPLVVVLVGSRRPKLVAVVAPPSPAISASVHETRLQIEHQETKNQIIRATLDGFTTDAPSAADTHARRLARLRAPAMMTIGARLQTS